MKRRSQIVIAIALLAVLFFGFGKAVAACFCEEVSQQTHACCREQTVPLSHLTQEIQSLKNHGCHCAIGTSETAAAEGVAWIEVQQTLILGTLAYAFSEIRFPGTLHRQIWLRRLYYPDKSHTYLQVSRLLI